MNLKQMKGILTGRYGKLPNPGNAQLARRAAADGMVLLKNEGVLPLREKRVALFGAGAVDTVICGTGSGYVFPAYTVNIWQGLKNAGVEVTSEGWLKRFAKTSKIANKRNKSLSFLDRMWSGKKLLIDDLEITDQELSTARQAQTAIYVIRRSAGEEADRTAVEGDYYLSSVEWKNLEAIAASFEHTIVVLNTCVMDANFLNDIPGIHGAVYINLPGMEGGNALADVLLGKADPGGRLTDTWAKRYEDYPASATFSSNDGNSLQEDYTEDIYVGYRHFDSSGIEPLFPFGYGLSYTSFSIEWTKATADWKHVSIEAAVTNTGKRSGRQVVQLYASAPAGKLDKPRQELKAYGKTRELKPGETEHLTLAFPTESLASFDEDRSAWVMEAGSYKLRIGAHSRSTQIAAVLELDGEAVTRQVTDVLHMDRPLERKKPVPYAPEAVPGDAVRLVLHAADCETVDNVSRQEKTVTTYVPEGAQYTPYMGNNPYKLPYPCEERVVTVPAVPNTSFLDVHSGKVSLEAFVSSLEPEVLTRIVTGVLEETPYKTNSRMAKKLKPVNAPQSSGQTTGQYVSSLGIPNAYLCDGPAGMHIIGCAATSFPVGIALAQTWDDMLIAQIGAAYGKDMEAYQMTVALGPGMNIHRDPLCGRNFEYYAEDPLLTGKIAVAFVRGIQTLPGRGVSVKHFATNNQENDRLNGNNTVSPRALREIYLKGFEIVVREANPMTVMTSYNLLNGVHTSSNRELLTDVLRGEWGFDGFVMTDWGTTSEKGFDLHAGNDLIMGGYRAEKLLDMMRDIPPAFQADGSVQETVQSSHFGMVKTVLTAWGSFQLEVGGKDQVSTHVEAGTSVGNQVQEAVKAGYARVEENPDGSCTVIYQGTYRGAYLPLGDLQACTIRVLKGLMGSAAMESILKNSQ